MKEVVRGLRVVARKFGLGRFILQLKPVPRMIWLSLPKLVECNVCGWRGRHFLNDGWHRNMVCPKCTSEVRHRLMVAALTELSYARIAERKRILHFAAEPVISSILQKYSSDYVTADYLRAGFDLKLDITHMPLVKDNEFDLIVACGVLEHVEDDKEAMHEIYRILRPSGYAILTVPQKDDLEETFEDPSIVDADARERAFGQWDHVRIFGNNFPSLLESVGFEVEVIDASNFDDSFSKMHILFPPVLSDKPLATNHRKVFFAHKI